VLLLVLSEAAAAADMDSTPVGPLTERAAAAEWPARTTPVAGGAPPLRTTLLRLCHESRRRTPVLSRVRPHSLQSALERPTRVARAQKSRHGGILHLQFHHLKSSLSSARPPDADIWFSGRVFFYPFSRFLCIFILVEKVRMNTETNAIIYTKSICIYIMGSKITIIKYDLRNKIVEP
jgi:hypothetical protein